MSEVVDDRTGPIQATVPVRVRVVRTGPRSYRAEALNIPGCEQSGWNEDQARIACELKAQRVMEDWIRERMRA